MSVYLISYDLNKGHKDYKKIEAEIRLIDPSMLHVLDSQWLVSTSESAKQINAKLANAIDRDDDLLITEITDNYSGYLRNSDAVHAWIDDRIRH